MYSNTVEKLIELFSKFPTVGPKTAARFVFYILKTPKQDIEQLINTINKLKEKTKTCDFCYMSYEENECPICSKRKTDTVCIVEKEVDLQAIEKLNKYKGKYFILGGTINIRNNKEILENRLNILINKIDEFNEIILALNPTVEGENTTLWIERKLKPYNKKTTRLAIGLPRGGELEYADEDTLASALESRK